MKLIEQAKKIERFVKLQLSYKEHFATINEMRKNDTYIELTKEQRKEVQDYYNKYFGEKINLKWHEYYLKVNGEFSPKYIPTYIYYSRIYPALNDTRIAVVYSDKNFIDKLLGNLVVLPKTYIKNVNGIFYNNDNIVSKNVALDICLNINDAVIKHSLDTCQGKSILRFKCNNGIVNGKDCPNTIRELFDNYEKNFIIQDAIIQNDTMNNLNPTSLNTVRIMTYWSKNGIVPIFSVIRIGRKGSVVDNASAGGMYCGVNMDGTLKDEAYTLTPFKTFKKTDTGIEFGKFKIPGFEILKSKAIELHSKLPYAKIIGWDLCINSNNDVELVEINANSPGLFQGATGPAFGEYTEEILNIARNN